MGSNEKKQQAVSLIRHNVVGFDLNPLAVIASRTNYLFALGPLLRYRGAGTDFEIPVYLTDSVLLPGRTESQQSLFAKDTVPFPMTVGTFNVPKEVVEDRKVPDLMNLLHDCIAEKHSRDAFINRSVKQLKLTGNGTLRTSLGTLFDAMRQLDDQGKNRVWAKLISKPVRFVVLPPLFRFCGWQSAARQLGVLTPEWRKAAENEYKHYGLFTLKGLESRHGGGKKDIAALFTYAVLDHFVKDGGILAPVVHVSLFKTSGAGEGYRRFQLGQKEKVAIEEVHDFKSFQPFQTHAAMRIKTRTVTFRGVKGKPTTYPVEYTTWKKTVRGIIPGNLTWEFAETRLESVQLTARPLRGTTNAGRLSPWLTLSTKQYDAVREAIAPIKYEPSYQGREGINSGGLNGAYFLKILELESQRYRPDRESARCWEDQVP